MTADKGYSVPVLSTPLAFDLETVADATTAEFMPEPEAPKGWKDPEKIAAEIARKKVVQLEKMALDPNFANIVSCGFAGRREEDGEVWSMAATSDKDLSEKDLLCAVWDILRQPGTGFITFFGISFDIPMLLHRSMVLGVTPTVHISRSRYDIPPKGNHYDLCEILGHHGNRKTGGLDTLSQLVLGEKKDVEGAAKSNEVGKLWNAGEYEMVSKRAARDAELTLRLWMKASGVYFIVPSTRR